MKKILTYILIFLTFSCVEKKERISTKTNSTELKTETTVETKKTDSLFINPNDFKYRNLNEFDLRGWYYGKMEKELKSLTKQTLIEYFQDNRIEERNIFPANFKYFSIQKNVGKEKIITIIENDESCCSSLHYLVYNERNILLSDNIVAGTGGDGMWSYDQYGKFLNDSTYILTRVDFDETEPDVNPKEMHIDSVITKFRFYKDKNFEKLTEQKFKKVEKD